MLKLVVNRRNGIAFALAVLLLTGLTQELDAQGFRRARYSSASNSMGSSNSSVISSQAVSQRQAVSHRHIADRVQPNLDDQQIQVSIQKALTTQIALWDNAESRSPWGVMHNALAWGVKGEILINGQRKNSIIALCENQKLKSVKMLTVTDGRLTPLEGPGLQGHPGQFLAVLAQNNIAVEQPIRVDDFEFSVKDLIDCEKQSCDVDVELTFKLLALCHYCGTDCNWENSNGESWSIEKLLAEELKQPINRVTCGGTHRLMAISLAVAKRESQELSMDGIWASAKTYVADYHEYAFTLFNPDGSFSTEWFERRAAASDLQKRLQTTGHVLEWLVVTVSDEEITSSRMKKSVSYVSQLLQLNIGEPWSVGPRAHALRSLRLYQQRVENLESNQPELMANSVSDDTAETVESR